MNSKLIKVFEQLEDNRRSLSKLHNLNDILVMAIIAVICGADSWNDIEEYCLAKEKWISKFLNLQNGIPSHDTFNRVINNIDSQSFEKYFIPNENIIQTNFDNWFFMLYLVLIDLLLIPL